MGERLGGERRARVLMPPSHEQTLLRDRLGHCTLRDRLPRGRMMLPRGRMLLPRGRMLLPRGRMMIS